MYVPVRRCYTGLRPEFVLDFLGANHFGFRSRNGFARTGFQRKTRKKNSKFVLEPVWFDQFWSFRVVSCRFVSFRRYILQIWCGRRSLVFMYSRSPTSSIATTRVAEEQLQLQDCWLSSNSPACCTATPRHAVHVQQLANLMCSIYTTCCTATSGLPHSIFST